MASSNQARDWEQVFSAMGGGNESTKNVRVLRKKEKFPIFKARKGTSRR